jgi:hypothetical protein
MTRSSQTFKKASLLLLFVFLAQACMQVRSDTPSASSTMQIAESTASVEQVIANPSPTATVAIPTPTKTELPPTATLAPKVIFNVVKGNLFIRRGPDMAFNPIGVLYKDTSVEAIARDVLSKWVQIKIPNSDQTGWVSVQTDYSQVEGKLEDLPEYTPTEWPVAAYVRNCTHHRMFILPGEILLSTSFEAPDNEAWVYPGTYKALDIDVPGEPVAADFSIKEGGEVEIREDGLGEKRKCP